MDRKKLKLFKSLFLEFRDKLNHHLAKSQKHHNIFNISQLFMMQSLFLWRFQSKLHLDGNPRYLIEKFRTYSKLKFRGFHAFLSYLFLKMIAQTEDHLFVHDSVLGKILITGTAPLMLNGIRGEIIAL